ncbi:helix-turn-helix domain-containing protein [Streptomyces sp. NBC_00249]|uniref:ATP-binding protein n=1 Tax=Streptomyces sp. NBC_00249 TaxID=2975690 RepID=UPI0022513C9B|nr:XRE family transcriptional regulator [Streptomyces sp. NBC_00249]MCX5195498.1 helix-turn-helix domain-containing protein [Streptomyces sp. NBC_00249]
MGTGTPAAGELGHRLRELRTRAGLSQEELSHASGVSVRALADLERGRTRGPQRRTVQALARALELDPAGTAELEHAAGLGRPRAGRNPGRTGPKDRAGTAGRVAAAGLAAPALQAGRAAAAGRAAHHALALPRDVRDFTARGPDLERLDALVEEAGPAHPPVVVVPGQPGLGKTAFAVRAAHRLAPRFPDGAFALDLHGTDPRPTPPHEALARLLRALGIAQDAIPAGTEDRSGLLRSALEGRRVLLLLDNAADEAQVRPLLPGTGYSLTLVTSRHALAGLASVHRSELALLRREEAVELLTRIVGAERVGAEPQAARDLAGLCGYLPLAVRIAGQRLAARPHERLARLVAQLSEEGGRLDALHSGELRVRAAFALSYRQLPADSRTLLRRAALAAGPDFSAETAALLAGLPLARAARCAEELTDAGLLQSDPAAERYRFHDLLRLFAAGQLDREDGSEVCEAAQDRAARWMLRRATAAALRFDADRHRDPCGGDPDPAGAPVGREGARAWLEAERAQWVAALRRSRAAGRHREVVDAAEAMHWFSDLNQHWELWVEVFRGAVDSARALGSRREEAVQLNYLAWSYSMCAHDHRRALEAADAALALAREVGDELQVGWALGYGAGALHRAGRVGESLDRFRAAADCLGAQGSAQARLGELTTLNALGDKLRQAGRAGEALGIHLRSEAACRAGIPGQPAELLAVYLAVARQQVGNDLAALGRWSEAEAPLRLALSGFEAARMSAWSEPARLDLGRVLRRLARHREARETLVTACAALGELGSPRQGEAVAELRALDAPAAGSGAVAPSGHP